MNKTYISTSELRSNIADILNEVHFNGKVAVIERYGEPIAEIVPRPASKKAKGKDLDEVLNKYFGSMPDFPDVTTDRRSRKKMFTLDPIK